MKRKTPATALNVSMNGRLVGKLVKEESGKISFSYAKIWLDREKAIPISLSLPLQTAPHQGAHVISFFNNLLPDSDTMLKRIAERTGAKGMDAYSLLSQIGQDGVGALQFMPENIRAGHLPEATYKSLNDLEIKDILVQLESHPIGINPELGFRISIAGAQEKTALSWHNGQWCMPIGLNPTTHILKPQIGQIDFDGTPVDFSQSVENEFYCLNLMRAFGLETANVQMHTFIDQKVLIVERFDRLRRADGGVLRLPQEDMCQALGYAPTQKYQNVGGPKLVDILELLKNSDTPYADQSTVMMAQILFWLIGATDGHAKNFSLFLRPNRQMRLTPLYDVLSSQMAFDAKKIPHKDYRLAMSVGRKPHYKILNIHGRYFVETAQAAGLGASFARACIENVRDRFDGAFTRVLTALPEGFPMHIHEQIEQAARQRLPALQTAYE